MADNAEKDKKDNSFNDETCHAHCRQTKRILSDLYCFMHILRIIHEQSQG